MAGQLPSRQWGD